MQRLIQFVLANIGMAIIYAIAGSFTQTLSLPPSGAAPLWAPTGIALAATLIWGYGLLPGVFLGDFLVAYYVMDGAQALNLCFLFGFQAAFQAGFGRYLLTQFQVWPSTLILSQSILRFFILAGVVSTFFPALIVLIVEQYLGVLDQSIWFETLIIWWLGGALGVVIFTPICLILFAKPKLIWRSRIISFAIPMTLLFIALVFVFHNARDREQEHVAYRFDDNVRLAHALVERRLEQYQSQLRSMRAFIQNSVEVTEQELKTYIDDASEIEIHTPYRLAWAERVLAKERSHYEKRVGYAIKDFDSTTGQFVPAGDRAAYYVAHYLPATEAVSDAFASSVLVQGIDLCGIEHHTFSCQQIAEAGQGYILPLLADPAKPEVGKQFLYVLPVFDANKTMSGLVYQLYDQNASIDDFLTSDARQWVELKISEPMTGKLLFSTFSGQESKKGYGDKALTFERLINVAGQEWQFIYSPSQYFIERHSSWMSYWIMVGAFFVYGLLAMWLMTLTGRAQQINKEVKDKTSEIADKVKLLGASEAKYRCLVENIQDKYFLYRYDENGVYSYVSPSVTSLLGYEQSSFLKHYSAFLVDSELNQHAIKMISQTLAGQSSHYDIEVLAQSGELHTLNVHETPIYDESHQTVLGAEGIARDITESKKAQQFLEKLSLAIKYSPNAVVIIDREGTIEYVNPKFTAITGYSANEAIGKWPDIIKSENTDPTFYKNLWEMLISGVEWHGELQNHKKNGDLYWAQEIIVPIQDESGYVTHFVVTQEDITEEKQIKDQTSYQASHDLLTGLMNRHEFALRLDRSTASVKRDLTEHALCYMDLDQFKIVNDTCGHMAGDELLRQISALLAANVRSRDTLARLGGDEFGLLMEHCGIEQAYQACELIIDLFKKFRFRWDDHVFSIGVSIGLAIIDQHIKSSAEAMQNADAACYEAKNAGRNQIKVQTDDHARLEKRRGDIQWSNEINDALENNRLLLYAQPIAALSDASSSVGYEVLMRMQMENGEIAQPDAFLPAAERFNSASRIDRWVVSHTVQWMNGHVDQLAGIEHISINLSGQSLGDEAMTEYIIRELESSVIPASKIKFEITETAAIANLHDATLFINALKAYGCRFALDDFGSGLSSFAYLKHLGVDTLKIDGMFIKDMLTDAIDYEMVKSINQIGHVMGLETVAEFVESEAILDKLKEIGVDYGQGYAIGKPILLEALFEEGTG